MLEVTHRLHIPDTEFHWSFVRSGGPGGQNVNKVASKAMLRWDVMASRSLPADIKERFVAQHRQRLTTTGELIVTSQRYRDQERNRQDCLDKLRELVRQAALPPRHRRATGPSKGAKERRLQAKRRRAATKAGRKRPSPE